MSHATFLWVLPRFFLSGYVCALLFSPAHALHFFGSIPCLSLFSKDHFVHPFGGLHAYLCCVGPFPNILLQLFTMKPTWSHCFHDGEIRLSDWGPLSHISVSSRDQSRQSQMWFINMRLEHPISLSLMRSQDAKPV